MYHYNPSTFLQYSLRQEGASKDLDNILDVKSLKRDLSINIPFGPSLILSGHAYKSDVGYNRGLQGDVVNLS